jgi:hypothetical protein
LDSEEWQRQHSSGALEDRVRGGGRLLSPAMHLCPHHPAACGGALVSTGGAGQVTHLTEIWYAWAGGRRRL